MLDHAAVRMLEVERVEGALNNARAALHARVRAPQHRQPPITVDLEDAHRTHVLAEGCTLAELLVQGDPQLPDFVQTALLGESAPHEVETEDHEDDPGPLQHQRPGELSHDRCGAARVSYRVPHVRARTPGDTDSVVRVKLPLWWGYLSRSVFASQPGGIQTGGTRIAFPARV